MTNRMGVLLVLALMNAAAALWLGWWFSWVGVGLCVGAAMRRWSDGRRRRDPQSARARDGVGPRGRCCGDPPHCVGRGQMTAWIAWFVANWQLIALFALGIGSLTFYWDRHPETAERICDRIASTR